MNHNNLKNSLNPLLVPSQLEVQERLDLSDLSPDLNILVMRGRNRNNSPHLRHLLPMDFNFHLLVILNLQNMPRGDWRYRIHYLLEELDQCMI